MTTERNRTPLQIWIEGMMINATSGYATTEEFYSGASMVSLAFPASQCKG